MVACGASKVFIMEYIIMKACLMVLVMLSMFILTINPAMSDTLSAFDRLFLAKRVAAGKTHVSLMVAIELNRKNEFLRLVSSFDGKILYSAPEVGYYRLIMPTKNALKFSNHQSVLSAAMPDGPYYLQSSEVIRRDEDNKKTLSYDSELISKLDLNNDLINSQNKNQISLHKAMHGEKILLENPTFDGRGTTIAVVEYFPDARMPELQTAKTIEGRSIKKILGAKSAFSVDPDASIDELYQWNGDRSMLSYVRLSDKININVKHSRYQGRDLLFPQPGVYRLGQISVNLFKSKFKPKVESVNSKSSFITIVHDVGNNCYWIDFNQNDVIADDECYYDYNDRHEVYSVKFNDNDQAMPFIIGPTDDDKSMMIAIPNAHTDAVTLAAAGSKMFGSDYSGIAPGAAILPIAVSWYNYASIIEGLLVAVRDQRVDIVTLQLGDTNIINTKNSLFALVADRIVEHYNKLIFISAGNATDSLNTISSLAAASNVIAVGQFRSENALKLFSGVMADERIPLVSSGGPSEDGAIKPDIVAPSLMIQPYADKTKVGMTGECANVRLYPGTTCVSGTSIAAPVAAGAAAILLSAVRQKGWEVDAKDLRFAITMSARFIESAPAYRQGNGLIDINAALQMLERLRSIKADKIVISAPVRTTLTSSISLQSNGRGLYEREGWSVGMTGRRTVIITRLTGHTDQKRYSLRLVGNSDGTFNAPEEIVLPLGRAVSIDINISPKRSGIHSALLEIFDISESIPVGRVGLTVISAPSLDKSNGYRLTMKSIATPSSSAKFFFNVPANTRALYIRYSPFGAQTLPILYGPTGNSGPHPDHYVASERSTAHEFRFSDAVKLEHGRTDEQSVFMPSQGLWSLVIQDTSFLNNGEYLKRDIEYEATITAVISDDSDHLEKKIVNSIGDFFRSVSVESLHEPVIKFIGGKEFYGSVNLAMYGLPHIVEIEVPDGTGRIDINSFAKKYKGLLTTIALFECKGGQCFLRDARSGINSAGIVYDNPTPGIWKISIDASRILKQNVEIDYAVMLARGDYESVQLDDTIFNFNKEIILSRIESEYKKNIDNKCFYIELVDNVMRPVEYLLAVGPDGIVGRARSRAPLIPLARAPIGAGEYCRS